MQASDCSRGKKSIEGINYARSGKQSRDVNEYRAIPETAYNFSNASWPGAQMLNTFSFDNHDLNYPASLVFYQAAL